MREIDIDKPKKPCDECTHKYNYRKCMVCEFKKFMIPREPKGLLVFPEHSLE